MKKKTRTKSIALISALVIVILLSLIIYTSATFQNPWNQGFEEKREELVKQLYSNIKEASLEGKYECCIEPPCTMCYLGNWIWDDGTCSCDEMIQKGELDKVCPQCKKDAEEGGCESSSGADESFCEFGLD